MWTMAVERSTPAPKQSRTEVTRARVGDWRWLAGTKNFLNQKGRRLATSVSEISAITATLVHITSMFPSEEVAVAFPVNRQI